MRGHQPERLRQQVSHAAVRLPQKGLKHVGPSFNKIQGHRRVVFDAVVVAIIQNPNPNSEGEKVGIVYVGESAGGGRVLIKVIDNRAIVLRISKHFSPCAEREPSLATIVSRISKLFTLRKNEPSRKERGGGQAARWKSRRGRTISVW